MAAFYISAFRGIGKVASQELTDRFGSSVKGTSVAHMVDLDLVFFSFQGKTQELSKLGTAEDVYFLLDKIPLEGTPEDLAAITQAATLSEKQPALAQHKQLHPKASRGRTTYRVVAQAPDSDWRKYRRVDMQRALERGLAKQYPKWKLVADDADIEFWIQQAGKIAVLGLRLSDKTLRHRTYKQENLPGSLRPTIAYALAYLSKPEPDDVFLDPMCGAGTILIERARAGRYKQLLGGDIRPEAVEATHANFGNKHKPWEVTVWDARKLPLDDHSVTKIVTNLPWGRQIGSPEENKLLYQDFLKEASRVLVSGGRTVVLTSQWKMLDEAIHVAALRVTQHIKNVNVLGWHADIFVISQT